MTDNDETQISVYPVGVLRDLAHRRYRQGWRYLVYQARAGNWRAVRNAFDGYLAEPQYTSMHFRRAGHGWTKRRALADLGRHLGEMNTAQKGDTNG